VVGQFELRTRCKGSRRPAVDGYPDGSFDFAHDQDDGALISPLRRARKMA
jgi:hypothetical protein